MNLCTKKSSVLFQSQAGIEAERLRVNSSIRSLQQQLEDCRDESSHWMEQFHTTRDELRTTKQEWVCVIMSYNISFFTITCLVLGFPIFMWTLVSFLLVVILTTTVLLTCVHLFFFIFTVSPPLCQRVTLQPRCTVRVTKPTAYVFRPVAVARIKHVWLER